MSTELYWLMLTVLMTSLFWIPYILNRIKVMGMTAALTEKGVDVNNHEPWGQRCRLAHMNAVENLALFAPAVIVLELVNGNTALTATAAAVYFFARLAHFFIYTAALPYLRTVSFAIAWFAQLAIILSIPGWI